MVARRILVPITLGVAAGLAVDILYYAFILLTAKELPSGAVELLPCVWAPLFYAAAPLIAALVAARTSSLRWPASRPLTHPPESAKVPGEALLAGLLAGLILFCLALALTFLPQIAGLFV